MIRAIALLLVAGVVVTACEIGGAPRSTSPADQIIIASDLPASAFQSDGLPAQQAIAFAIHQQGSIERYSLGYMPLDDSLAALPSPARGIGNVARMVDLHQVLGMIGLWRHPSPRTRSRSQTKRALPWSAPRTPTIA